MKTFHFSRFILAAIHLPLAAVVGCLTSAAFGKAPANDRFANPQVIAGVGGSAAGTNVNATLEAGEPTATAGRPGGNSVWFRWVAPASASFTFSIAANFDSQLAVYMGVAVSSLQPVAQSDTAGSGGDSVTLTSEEGTIYLLRVAGYQFANGPFTLTWSANPVVQTILRFEDAAQAVDSVSQNGSFPTGDLVRGDDGSFYGTTGSGGAGDRGTVFKITPGGVLTTLVECLGGSDSGPGNLLLDGSGNFYWTTFGSDDDQGGTIDRMAPSGAITVLKYFSLGLGDGGYYPNGLVLGRDGNLYGTTAENGAFQGGSIFKMTPGGSLTTLVEFYQSWPNRDNRVPSGGLVEGTDGNFYGATIDSSTNDDGAIFKTTPAGELTTLVEFSGTGGSNRGSLPEASLVQAPDGNFYGTTTKGGINDHGTIFKMTPDGVLTTLVDFTGVSGPNRGNGPRSTLFRDTDGNFYGTTTRGGINDNGTLFKMTPAGVLTTLVAFTGTDGLARGSWPAGRLAKDDGGNFYGTTAGGGRHNKGTIFMVTSSGALTTLYEFSGATAPTRWNLGSNPKAGLVEDSDGNFYGTTQYGGGADYGTVFKLTPDGHLASLVEFAWNAESTVIGLNPEAALTLGSDGNFYGTTPWSFYHNGVGPWTVFTMTPAGLLTTLLGFGKGQGDLRGSSPRAALVQGADGNFLGTTHGGGLNGHGTLFKMMPDGWFATLVDFTGTGGNAAGRGPRSALVPAADGSFYGTTDAGGANDCGTIFKMTSGGSLATLVDFTDNGGSDRGKHPTDGLVQGGDGNFYGTTSAGGANDSGTVFRMTREGDLTTLAEFGNLGGNFTSTSNWQNIAIGSRSGSFDLTFHLTPLNDPMDGVTGLSLGSADGYTDLACVLRLNPDGYFDARNGGRYLSSTPLAYVVGHEYYVRMRVNVGARTYSVWVDGTTIADNFTFRTEQAETTGLDTLTITGESGSHRVKDVSALMLKNPNDGLALGRDGNLYGTTPGDGWSGHVFKLTPGGVLTPLGDTEGTPCRMVLGTDGNLYGTTSFDSPYWPPSNPYRYGSIYRLMFPGKPLVIPLPPAGLTATEASLQGKVTPRGALTTVSIEYGNNGVDFPHALVIATNLTGNESVPAGWTLRGLTPATNYFYRFRAINNLGETLSAVRSFSTAAAPTVAVAAATDILATSAMFNGIANARYLATTAVFEYGTDGNSFPNRVLTNPATVTGNTDLAVSAAVTNLAPGQTYYYRIVATNLVGTAVSGPMSFSTLPYTFTSAAGVVTITGYVGCGEAACIPDTIGALPVTTIGCDAFANCAALTSVTIPASVTSMGKMVFAGCRFLTKATFLGDAPTMDPNVFHENASNFTVYYYNDKTGFTSPLWKGYPAVSMEDPSSPLGIWLFANGLPYSADLKADPNGDGAPLLMAYALNLDPKQNLSANMPRPVIAADQMNLTFYAGNADVTYTVETSTDLKNWSTDGVSLSPLDAVTKERTATFTTPGTIRFLRLVVAVP